MPPIAIRALIFKEEGRWCAQCLEYDIAVQASSRQAVVDELTGTLERYVQLALSHNRQPFEGIPAAPENFFDKWARQAPKKKIVRPKTSIPAQIRLEYA